LLLRIIRTEENQAAAVGFKALGPTWSENDRYDAYARQVAAWFRTAVNRLTTTVCFTSSGARIS
jgi:hypothetical protein